MRQALRIASILIVSGFAFGESAYAQHQSIVNARKKHPLYDFSRVSIHRVDDDGKFDSGMMTDGNLDESFLQVLGPNRKANEAGSDVFFTPSEKDKPFWRDLHIGGVWIEYADSNPGTAFYLQRGEPLPENIHKVGRVKLFHTISNSEPLALRLVKAFKKGEIELPTEEFSDTPAPQTVEEWMQSLYNKNQIGLADVLQLNPYPHPALDKDHLYATTGDFENWDGYVTTGEPQNHPSKAPGGYSLEHEDRPGVFVYYPLNEELPNPDKNGDFKINIYPANVKFEKGQRPKPILQISTSYYPEGARLKDIKSKIEQVAASGDQKVVPHINPEAFGPTIKVIEVPSFVKEGKAPPRQSVTRSADGSELTYRLFAKTIKNLGSSPAYALKQNGWQAQLEPSDGFWVRAKGITDDFVWLGREEVLKFPRDNSFGEFTIEILYSVYPEETRARIPSAEFHKLFPRITSGPTDPITLNDLLKKFPVAQEPSHITGLCGTGLAQVGKIVQDTWPPPGYGTGTIFGPGIP